MNTRLRSCGALVGVVLLSACSTSPPSQTELMRQAPSEVVVSATELRIRMRLYAHRFAHVIEEAADDIIQGAESREIQRAALEWKVQAIPQAQTTCFRGDPLAALYDTWAFADQQRQFFESDEATRPLGESGRQLALEAALTIEEEIEEIARSVKRDGDISKSREFVEEWAAAHPVAGEWLLRESIMNDLATIIAAENLGTFARVGRLSEDMYDLSMRASLYNEMLPKQTRWHAQLLVQELGVADVQDIALDTIPELTRIAERLCVLAESIPALVEQEREIILARVAAERATVMNEVRGELGRSLALVSSERQAVLEGVDRIVSAQWPAIRDDLPMVTGESVGETVVPLAAVIDHTIWRVAQLLGAGLAVLVIFGLVAIRMLRR